MVQLIIDWPDVTDTILSPPALGQHQAHLRILATTDLHMHVMPYDYFADKAQPQVGLARAAGLIRQLRSGCGASILLDNGDFLQGTPLSDWVAEDSGLGPDDLHPMIGAMNALGYDAGTLGNHDFNYGLPFLQAALAQAAFPVVSANVTTAQGPDIGADQTLQPAWTILPRDVQTADGAVHRLRIGVIGFAPPQTQTWEQFSVGDAIGTRDIVAAARTHVPALRAAGADIVIALGHTGVSETEHTPGMENAAIPLAAVDGIDAVVAGHTHKVFPGPGFAASDIIDADAGTLHGKPAVMAGFHGSHVGVIDLVLERSGDGWAVAGHHTAAPGVDSLGTAPDDSAVSQSIRPAHEQVISVMRQQIGETEADLHSHLSLIGHSTALAALSDALLHRSRTKVAGTALAGLPMAVAVAPSRSGGQGGPDNYVDIPAGPLFRRHAAELYHYPNCLCVLQVTGSFLRDWLEWSARLFCRLTPGKTDQELIDSGMPGYNFDTLFGLRYTIDLSRPAATAARNGGGQRIKALTLADGTPLTDNMPVLLATNTYRAAGGGGYALVAPDQIAYRCNKGIREVVVGHMQNGPLRPCTAPPWQFAGLPGTTALFDSSADALTRLPTDATTRISTAGAGANGFSRFRLHL